MYVQFKKKELRLMLIKKKLNYLRGRFLNEIKNRVIVVHDIVCVHFNHD